MNILNSLHTGLSVHNNLEDLAQECPIAIVGNIPVSVYAAKHKWPKAVSYI